MQTVRIWALLAGIVSATQTTPAHADPPATAGALQLGVGFRYGVEMNDGDFNPWGVGLGVDGGYTLPNALYLGGNFDYFFGEEIDTGLATFDGNLWQLMGEGGYDIGLGDHFVIRPKVGLGVANMSVESCVDGLGCEDNGDAHFAMAPGVKLMLFTPVLNVSFDTRYDIIFADDETAKALIFSAGIGF